VRFDARAVRSTVGDARAIKMRCAVALTVAPRDARAIKLWCGAAWTVAVERSRAIPVGERSRPANLAADTKPNTGMARPDFCALSCSASVVTAASSDCIMVWS
jgi:hypothetical protein